MLYPPELLKRILYHVTDRQDLAECSRVSTAWRREAIPYLYERFHITSLFSDEKTARAFLANELGHHVRHLRLDMALLEDLHRPQPRPLQIQQRTSSLRRRGFKLFPGNNKQRRSSLIDMPQPQQQQQQHTICFAILAMLQSCTHVQTVELHFNDRTFTMSRNAVFLFSQWQPLFVTELHLVHLTRLIVTPHLQTLTQWISQRKVQELVISHCVASIFTQPIDLTGVSVVRITALSLWDPVSATNVLPDIRWPSTLKSLTVLDSPDWLHQSDVLQRISEQCNLLHTLRLAITPNPSPSASFFLLQPHRKFCLDNGLIQVLAACPLRDLSVEGLPTLSDSILTQLWKLPIPLQRLTLRRNTRLCGSEMAELVLLHRGCFATDRIDFSANPSMDPDFLRCVKLTSNYAVVTW